MKQSEYNKIITAAALLLLLCCLFACTATNSNAAVTTSGEPPESTASDITSAVDTFSPESSENYLTEAPDSEPLTLPASITIEVFTRAPADITSSQPEKTEELTDGTTAEAESETEASLTSEAYPQTDAPVTTEAVIETEPAVTTEAAPRTVRVGISDAGSSQENSPYVLSVINAGFEPVILPEVSTAEAARSMLNTVDALIMTGGEDIDPKYYGETILNSTLNINSARDVSDIFYLTEAVSRDMPTLCICRGMQLLNIVCGGNLYQDLPTQKAGIYTHRDPDRRRFVYHQISPEAGSFTAEFLGTAPLYVNSWHHQSVKDPGSNIKVTACSPDGVIEAIEMTDKTYIVGVQFHPEKYASAGNKNFLKFFTALGTYAK